MIELLKETTSLPRELIYSHIIPYIPKYSITPLDILLCKKYNLLKRMLRKLGLIDDHSLIEMLQESSKTLSFFFSTRVTLYI